MSTLRAVVAAAATLCFGAPMVAMADTYPDRPVTIIIPFSAGSITDAVGRLLANHLGEQMGGRFVVENMPGANGAIAATRVAQSEPDGYTLFITTNTTQAANPAGMLRSIDYDPIEDFESITRIGNVSSMIVVGADLPVESLQDLIGYAQENPGTLNYATGNSTGVVAGATFAARAGVDIGHVPYRSTPDGLNDVIGGRVPIMITDVMTGTPHVQSGDLRALAAVTADRSPLQPDLPTLRESGVSGFDDLDFTAWFAFFAPGGTPEPIISQLNEATHDILERTEIRDQLLSMGFEPVMSSTEELDAMVASEIERWRALLQEIDFEPM